jgi:hypothetical protein
MKINRFIVGLAVTAALTLSTVKANAHVIPSPCDWATGGGFVIDDSNDHANFGFVAGCKHHHFFGHVNFIDHSIELHVSSLTITGYTEITPGTNRRDICGIAETNLFGEVGYHVVIVDKGEPGKHDRFGISLSNGYLLSTRRLEGGNVEIHKPNRSTTAPATFTECNSIAPDPGP